MRKDKEKDKKAIEWFEAQHKEEIELGGESKERIVEMTEYGMNEMTPKEVLNHMKKEASEGEGSTTGRFHLNMIRKWLEGDES